MNNEALEEWLETSREISWRNFKKQIRFYAPTFAYYKSSHFQPSPDSFPSISITGTVCALNCDHCQGRLLKGMISAKTPEKLMKVCKKIKENGGVGCLISGGCLPDGSVPLNRFTDAMAQIKKNLGLKIIVHAGLIDFETAQNLKSAGVDAALIDVIGSNETIKAIYHIDATVEDYEQSLKALHNSGIPIVPHILVGLHYGKLKGEYKAVSMISKYLPSAIVIIALTTIKGTLMEKVAPPEPEDVMKVLVAARLTMPKVPLALGCMRPLGAHRVKTDTLAVKAGVNAIAFPSEEAIELAMSMGLKTFFYPICCSQIYEDLALNP
ncbi:radical SAM protein [Candidatus Bathyarchaeota archaeon]|nr:radical SAM protein [Candidatus Bathyarchaeota archaeon]